MLPKRFSKIDETNWSDHYYIEPDDRCLYFGERVEGGYSASPTNQLIKNFKIKPSEISQNPYRKKYRQQAIAEVSAALRSAISDSELERITFVPIPGSKIKGHPDYCDRLQRALQDAFSGKADVRLLIKQTVSTDADHESQGNRSGIEYLRSILQIDAGVSSSNMREVVVLFDDVLTAGKHFRVCKALILTINPRAHVVGVFVARQARAGVSLDEFEDLSDDD